MGLNPQQQTAVDYMGGYGFVTACPGSGKTTVLTERTLKLIGDGIPPSKILCITFTNKAAKEMKERIKAKTDPNIIKRLWVSTFHSMGARILRKEIKHIPKYTKTFSIIDTEDQKAVIEKGIDELGYKAKSRKEKNGVDANSVLSKINSKKDTLQTDTAFRDDNDEVVCAVFNFYKDFLINANCMDFGDLLRIFYLLLSKNEAIREKYSKRFQYIMVDECQDLNVCQYELVKLLSSYHKNLVLIGDCDQSIYRFRHADPKHVFKYLDENKVDQLPLSYNYRSTQKIVNCANSLIKNNPSRVLGNIETVNFEGHPVKIVFAGDGFGEANWVADEIEALSETGNYKNSDFAILYRVNSHGGSFEQALRMKNIPCKVVGGRSFFDLDVVRTSLSYLQFYSNPNNILAFHKIVNKPRRAIASETVYRLERYCADNECTMMDVFRDIENIEIDGIGIKRKHELKKLYEDLKPKPEEDGSLYDTAFRIFKDSGYESYVKGEEDDDVDGETASKTGQSGAGQIYDAFMDMLLEWDKNYGKDLSRFLEYINLQTSTDDDDDGNSVKLMTIHSSKGLEFSVVFTVCVEEGNVPHKFSVLTGDPEDIEEERRLFYVGMTRAKKHLFVTSAKNRMVYGKTNPTMPSRFINEIMCGHDEIIDLEEDYFNL